MRTGCIAAWLLACVLCLFGTPAPALAAASAPSPPGLDNEGCLECHSGRKGKLEAKNADGEARELKHVDHAKFSAGVHAEMQCVGCHTNIKDSKTPHRIDGKARAPDCVACHERLWDEAKKEKKTKEKRRLGKIVDIAEEYKKSFHARLNKEEDEPRVFATCNECHNVHTFDIPPKESEEHGDWRVANAKMCGSCHEDQQEEFEGSIHGEQLIDEENPKAAFCSDCHTAHSTGNTSAVTVKQQIMESCGECHDEQFASFTRTEHAKLATHPGASQIRCTDCHGSHGIFLVTELKDPRQMVSQDNKMCMSCHNSDKKFEKFAPLKTGGKEGERIERPDLDEQHRWLPNTRLHWQAVRCIDCHTSADPALSHEILGEKKAARNCVMCHSKDSSMATRLYRHLAEEERQRFGFANSIILANSYVIGATRHPLLDTIIVALAVLMLIGVLGHGLIRYLGARARRKRGE